MSIEDEVRKALEAEENPRFAKRRAWQREQDELDRIASNRVAEIVADAFSYCRDHDLPLSIELALSGTRIGAFRKRWVTEWVRGREFWRFGSIAITTEGVLHDAFQIVKDLSSQLDPFASDQERAADEERRERLKAAAAEAGYLPGTKLGRVMEIPGDEAFGFLETDLPPELRRDEHGVPTIVLGYAPGIPLEEVLAQGIASMIKATGT